MILPLDNFLHQEYLHLAGKERKRGKECRIAWMGTLFPPYSYNTKSIYTHPTSCVCSHLTNIIFYSYASLLFWIRISCERETQEERHLTSWTRESLTGTHIIMIYITWVLRYLIPLFLSRPAVFCFLTLFCIKERKKRVILYFYSEKNNIKVSTRVQLMTHERLPIYSTD